VIFGEFELQGEKDYMEDRTTACFLESGALFAGVYDGHGGAASAEFAMASLHNSIPAYSSQNELASALVESFHATSEAFVAAHPKDESGTTAVVAVVSGGVLLVANAGDSRAVICSTAGVAETITTDHKPDGGDELARIESLGGVYDDFCGGVEAPDGSQYLKCARSLGDAKYKVGPRDQHLVCATPEVFTRALTEADDFLLLASDGVWDVLSDQKACNVVRASSEANARVEDSRSVATAAAEAVVRAAHEAGSEDNISAVVLLLRHLPSLDAAQVHSPSTRDDRPSPGSTRRSWYVSYLKQQQG